MPKFEVYDENVAGHQNKKAYKAEGSKFTTKKALKVEERKALGVVNNAPPKDTKAEARAPVEVRKSQRNEERRVLGCINNVKEANKKVVFPQKQRNRRKEQAQATGATAAAVDEEVVVGECGAGVITEGGDCLFADMYSLDVVQHLKDLEQRHGVRGDYMKKQAQLSHDKRSLLVDWLVEVSEGLNCPPEVIFHTCHYIDRFLSIMSVNDTRLQLLGITCLYLAWKFDDAPGAPYLSDLVSYTGEVCTDKEMVKMEKLVVKTLDFTLLPCSPLTFLNIFLHHQPLPPQHSHSAKYLLESCLLDGQRCLKYLPSITASACLCITRKEANLQPWTDLLTQVSGYRQEELERCVREVSRFKRCLPIDAYSNIPLKYQKYQALFKD